MISRTQDDYSTIPALVKKYLHTARATAIVRADFRLTILAGNPISEGMNERLQILTGDCREILRKFPDQTVQCCVTSPPYWGLRRYGGGELEIGQEKSPEEFVGALVDVFDEVWRVLKDDGTVWLNLGDSYSSSGCGGDTGKSGLQGSTESQDQSKFAKKSFRRDKAYVGSVKHIAVSGLPPKNLVGIPWRVAFALQKSGWYLRQDIIWHKPNPMPESVTNRCTKAHEYIFLLSKSERYYFDAYAIAEPCSDDMQRRAAAGHTRGANGKVDASRCDSNTLRGEHAKEIDVSKGRNKRSVWTISTHPYSEAHFATFPPDLIKPCILAGCPSGGLVLDPFGGSGTTGMVATELGRRAVLIELNPEYARMAEQRCHVTPGLPLGA